MYLDELKRILNKDGTIFIAGKADWGVFQRPGQLDRMKNFFNKYYGTIIIDKAGHWIQQEQPKKTFEAIYNFYKKIA